MLVGDKLYKLISNLKSYDFYYEHGHPLDAGEELRGRECEANRVKTNDDQD